MNYKTPSYLHCPECSSRMIQLIDKKKTIVYDWCSDCGGIWLEDGDLRQARKGESRTMKELWKQAKREKNNRDKCLLVSYPLLCPSCQKGRLKEVSKYGIVFDECEECHGKFLNKEEFLEISGTGISWFGRFKEFLKCLFLPV